MAPAWCSARADPAARLGDFSYSDYQRQAFIFMTLTIVYLDMAHQEHH
jgi:hypothetical protein